MMNPFDIHDYDEHFIEQFTTQTIPIYDLWSIRPLQNSKKEIITGAAEEIDKFSDFMNNHASKDFPHPLLIVIGNAEKNNPNNMSHTTKNYYKVKFEKYKGDDYGTPLPFSFPPNYPMGNTQMMPLSVPGYGQKQQLGNTPGVSIQDIQGIVDRNVSDATRSIRAEYEEVNARREADSIKRIAELEAKMELYKLEMRAGEVEQKEKKLQEMIEEFEDMRAEGMGTVKDYTKTIAGGLLELGKFALGMDDKDDKKDKLKIDKKKDKKTVIKEDLKGTSLDDDGFTETEENENNGFENLMGKIKNLSEEERYELLDILLPEDDNTDINDEETEENNDNEDLACNTNTEKKKTTANKKKATATKKTKIKEEE